MSDLEIVKRRILEHVPLAALLGEKITITARGGTRVACCPFHPEKTPSFYVYDDHYHCFGCRKHGDAIDYVRLEHGLSFVDALKFLAEKYGIEAPELARGADDRERYNKEAVYYKAMIEAQEYFAKNLAGPRGAQAREYLASRGFSSEKVLEYRFGLSFDDNSELTQRLIKSGFKHEELIACSLSDRSQRSGGYYDFFRNRVMVPICDGHGRIIAFAGRTMGDEQPKYRNSRETPIFTKKSVLFGLHAARAAMRGSGRDQGYAILVEGYMGTMQCWNYGFPQTVACMGTALGVAHLRQIAQTTRQIYLIFDGDAAGRSASLNTVKHALQVSGLSIKVVLLPKGEDPDDFLRARGAEPLRDLIDQATDLLDYAITTKLSGTEGLAVAELMEQDFVPWLRTIDNQFNYSFLVSKLSKLTGIPFSAIDRLVHSRSTTASAAALSAAPTPGGAPAVAVPVEPVHLANLVMPSFHSPQFELLGHLYFAAPGEVDATIARHLLHHEVEFDEAFLALGTRMIESLANGNGSPSCETDAAWMLGLHPQLFDFIDLLKQHAAAFRELDRNLQLLRLSRILKLKKLEESRAVLKAALLPYESQRITPEDMHRILTSISQINAEIKSLEKVDKL